MIRAAIAGRLGTDPVRRTTKTGKEMVTANVAVDCARQGEAPETAWFGLVAFGAAAETLAAHAKGDVLTAMGAVTRETFIGRDGAERQSWKMLVEALLSVRAVRNKPGPAGAAPRHRAPYSRQPKPTRDELDLPDDRADDLWPEGAQ